MVSFNQECGVQSRSCHEERRHSRNNVMRVEERENKLHELYEVVLYSSS